MMADSDFVLDERLAGDTRLIVEWPLCSVLLMEDCCYPWLILVPRRTNLKEIYELSLEDRMQLDLESCHLGKFLMDTFGGSKLNVAALGNVVSQLHIHHIVRYVNDAAWPAPVWGRHPAKPYDKAKLDTVLHKLEPLTRQFQG